MGPFETIDLNAPGGVSDYAARFGPLMGGITAEQTPYDYDAATVEKVAAERRAALPLDGHRRAERLARPAPDGAARAQARTGTVAARPPGGARLPATCRRSP